MSVPGTVRNMPAEDPSWWKGTIPPPSFIALLFTLLVPARIFCFMLDISYETNANRQPPNAKKKKKEGGQEMTPLKKKQGEAMPK